MGSYSMCRTLLVPTSMYVRGTKIVSKCVTILTNWWRESTAGGGVTLQGFYSSLGTVGDRLPVAQRTETSTKGVIGRTWVLVRGTEFHHPPYLAFVRKS